MKTNLKKFTAYDSDYLHVEMTQIYGTISPRATHNTP